MIAPLSRPALACALASMLLAACADKPARTNTSTTSTTTTTTTTTAPAAGKSSSSKTATPKTASTTRSEKLPDNTGIPACDDYLATYVACHQAANIFAPDQLQERYQMMRTSLLRDSLNPDIRPQLSSRCLSLSNQLHQALHGKSCNAPADSTSTPTPQK